MCKAVKLKAKEELLSVAEEIAFAKALAANDKTLRDRALKKLEKWFLLKSNQETRGMRFTEEGFMRLWKGLFYCVWMSDKPLIQEECVESISKLIHCFSHIEDARKFVRCFFQSISQAWFGLDGYRMDKYLMLVRRFVRQMLEYLNNLGWEQQKVELVCNDLSSALLMAPMGLNLHLAEIYLEELSKVGRGALDSNTILQMIKPFAECVAQSNDGRLIKYVNSFIFLQLLRQSDDGLKHDAKFEMWKEMGFPEGDINVIQEATDEDLKMDREDEGLVDDRGRPLDPRAGNVDVVLPPLDFDPRAIRDYLNILQKKKTTTTKARKAFVFIGKKYETFISGKYPLGIHTVEVPEIEDEEQIIEETARELIEEDRAFAQEKHVLKKGKQLSSDAWEVTADNESHLDRPIKKFSNKGIWEVKTAKKRKNKSKESPGSTMKKMKVSLDNSLNSSINDNADSEMNSEKDSTIESSSDAKIQPETHTKIHSEECPMETTNTTVNIKIKDNKKGNKTKGKKIKKPVKLSKKARFAERMRLYEEQYKKQQEEKRQKIEQADKEWGFTSDWDHPSTEENIVIPFTPRKDNSKNSGTEEPSPKIRRNSSGKKVDFALYKNTFQEVKEYKKALKLSPNIPMNFKQKPLQGVLKFKSIGSPLNPFYIQESKDDSN